jgi:hypothetical protein
VGTSLTVTGAAAVLDVDFHQPLGNESDHLANNVIGADLPKKLGKLHSVVGHRVLPHGLVEVS